MALFQIIQIHLYNDKQNTFTGIAVVVFYLIDDRI